MINRRHLLIIPVIALLIVLIWYFTGKTGKTIKVDGPDSTRIEHKYNGRRVLNLPPGREKEILENLKVTNIVSEEWQKKVEEALRLQGGDSLKDVSIQKVESLIWLYHGVALNVESVAVTLKNERKEQTRFRALIDSQNGKILQTWDQPVIDPANPRDKFNIKVDPRYLND